MELVFSDILVYALIFLCVMLITRAIFEAIDPQGPRERFLGSLVAIMGGMLLSFWLYTMMESIIIDKPSSSDLSDPANISMFVGLAIAYLIRKEIIR